MKKNFIEIYDNALPIDICDYLISLFERESMMVEMRGVVESTDKTVKEVRTMIDPNEGDTHYVSALDMQLYPQNYLYESIIGDLDHILKQKIFDYNKKYHVWDSELNMNLIPTEEERKLVEYEDNNPDILNEYIYRHGDYQIKKYRHPDDGYYAWHTDWGPMPEFIGRKLAVQFYLNDVEEGGETEFYHQEIKIEPKRGRLIVWPVGFTHIHRGNNPISNDKYVVSAWFTQKNLFR